MKIVSMDSSKQNTSLEGVLVGVVFERSVRVSGCPYQWWGQSGGCVGVGTGTWTQMKFWGWGPKCGPKYFAVCICRAPKRHQRPFRTHSFRVISSGARGGADDYI